MKLETITWHATPTRTFRRHLPVWVGLMRGNGRRVVGVYARLGHRSRGVALIRSEVLTRG
jgi:hypothetical protein